MSLLLLPPNVAAIAKLASREDGKGYTLACVRLRQTEDGYRVEATDGKRLGVVEGIGLAEGECFDDAPNGTTEVMLPTKEFVAAVKDGRPHTKFQLGVERVTAQTHKGHRLQITPVEGRFPDVDAVLPKTPPAVEIWVDARYLADMLVAAAAFSSADCHKVLLRYWNPDTMMAVVSESQDQRFFGVLMPLMGNRIAVPEGGPYLVRTWELADDPDTVAPVSGGRCRSCGVNAKAGSRDAVWMVQDGAAYCYACREYQPGDDDVPDDVDAE